MNDVLEVELMLLNWAKTATGGAKVIFAVSSEDLEKFESMTLAKGGRGGQRFMAALAMIADDEQPEPLRLGALGRLAVIWCKDAAFQEWIRNTYPDEYNKAAIADPVENEEHYAKAVLLSICGVGSRKEIDYSVDGRKMFNELVRKPYMDYVGEHP